MVYCDYDRNIKIQMVALGKIIFTKLEDLLAGDPFQHLILNQIILGGLDLIDFIKIANFDCG